MIPALILALTMQVSPDSLTLEAAYRAAADHNPRRAEASTVIRAGSASAEAVLAGLKPRVSISGQAVYHSDVAEIQLPLPGADFPSVPHAQYRAGVTAEYAILGRGTLARQADLLRLEASASAREAEVGVWQDRMRVEAAFFAVAKAEAQLATLDLFREEVQARLSQLEAAVAGGVATEASLATLQAELVRLDQQRAVAQGARQGAVNTLSILTGLEAAEIVVDVASALEGAVLPVARPEPGVFSAQRELLEHRRTMADEGTRPRVSVFSDVAVGQPPGLNLFGDQIEPFFSVGVRFGWPAVDWGAANRQREAIDLQESVVRGREAEFERAVRLQTAGLEAQVDALDQVIAEDGRVIDLLESVASDAANRLEAGTATATDYLSEARAASRARLEQRLHEIQRTELLTQLRTIRGTAR